MDSKFAFNKLKFVEMDRRNILLNRRPTNTSTSSEVQHQVNSSFLSRFLSVAPPKTKGSVRKSLFGRPEEGETKRLEERMFHQERIRALNLYQFDLVTQQPVNLTPPASPFIGHQPHSAESDRVQCPVEDPQGEQQAETVILKEQRLSGKRRSSEAEEEVEPSGHAEDEGRGKQKEPGSGRRRRRRDSRQKMVTCSKGLNVT